jgi:hypothetical protein
MNFNELYKRINNIDKGLTECGEPMGAMMGNQPTTPPPTMSVNFNAQGMDNIKSMMDLWTKVNPDMMPAGGLPPTPSLSDPSMSKTPTLQLTPPMGASSDDIDDLSPSDLGDNDLDIDIDGDDTPDIAIGSDDRDDVSTAMGDIDGDGDHDMDDHDAEKKEQYANSPDEHTDDHLKMIKNLAGGMNREKTMVKHSYKQGDNPMAMPESEDPLASIKHDLRSRLQNYKAQ